MRSPRARRLKRSMSEAIWNTSRGDEENAVTGGGPEAESAPPKASGAAHPTHSGSIEKSRAA
jgi:hypothetical protein